MSFGNRREESKKRKLVSGRLTLATIGIFAILFLYLSPASLAFSDSSKASAMPRVPPQYSTISPPSPPSAFGCYQYSTAQASWQSSGCVTASVASSLPRPTEGGDNGMVQGETSTSRILYASILLFPSAPNGVIDSVYGPGSFSIQLNTNVFTGNNGQTDWVQFTVQNFPKSNVALLCVWNIDVSTQKYTNYCMNMPALSISDLTLDYIQGAAMGGQYLMASFCFYVGLGYNCYGVTGPDTYDLTPNFKSVGGSILGIGNGSEANFGSGSSLYIETSVYYSSSASLWDGESTTAETNNLSYSEVWTPTCSGGYCTMWTYST